MKQSYINIFFLVAIAVLLWLNLRHEEKKDPANQINYELFEHRINESEKRIDSLFLQVTAKDSIIYENTNFVRTANRSTRDSLRAIHNPR